MLGLSLLLFLLLLLLLFIPKVNKLLRDFEGKNEKNVENGMETTPAGLLVNKKTVV